MSKPTCTVHRWRHVLAWCPLTRGFTRPAVVCHWCHTEAGEET